MTTRGARTARRTRYPQRRRTSRRVWVTTSSLADSVTFDTITQIDLLSNAEDFEKKDCTILAVVITQLSLTFNAGSGDGRTHFGALLRVGSENLDTADQPNPLSLDGDETDLMAVWLGTARTGSGNQRVGLVGPGNQAGDLPVLTVRTKRRLREANETLWLVENQTTGLGSPSDQVVTRLIRTLIYVP